MPAGRPTSFRPEYTEQAFRLALFSPLDLVDSGEVAIYALLDPHDRSVRYIGQTYSPKKRLAAHLCPGERTHLPVARWVRGLRDKGHRPEMVVLGWATLNTWEEKERGAIALARSHGYDLLNVMPGGRHQGGITSPGAPRTTAYTWCMRFCARKKHKPLADLLYSKMSEARKLGPSYVVRFNDALLEALFEAAPAIGYRVLSKTPHG